MRARHNTHPSVPPTAGGAFTRLAYARAKAAGIELDPILKASNLARPQIEDPSVRVLVRNQITFLNLLAGALNDDLLGFHLALTPDLRAIGWLYYVPASSNTVGEALQQGARCSSVINEGISLQYVDSDEVVLKLQYVGVNRHTDRQQIEAYATLLVRMCRELSGLPLKPERVQFMHHRAVVSSEQTALFGNNLEFGAAHDEIVFPAAFKSTPVVGADPYLHRLLLAQCEEALSRRRSGSSLFRSRAEHAIAPLLPHGKARIAEVASRLGLSQRTLARRLSLEGLTFSDVLEGLRNDLAKRHLADRTLSISEIAWLLGYRDVTAFTHAFRRWTGKSPREVRSSLA